MFSINWSELFFYYILVMGVGTNAVGFAWMVLKGIPSACSWLRKRLSVVKITGEAEKPISAHEHVAVDIILPERWWQPPQYRLREPLEVLGHRVPKGFITDGATVPRLFWSIFPPVGRYLKAATVHDWLLTRVDRRSADREFRKVMIALGVSPWRREVMYRAVRLFSITKLGWLRCKRISSIMASF